jgi:nucleoside 2-deoxyribosyltransferase
MKTFLICPVRGHSPEETQEIVASLEREGWGVHWPPRDTDQADPTGLRICADNRRAIAQADAVHVVWDGQSQGCLFDLGMAFAMGKRIIPIRLPDLTDGKSFQNMVTEWARASSPHPAGR